MAGIAGALQALISILTAGASTNEAEARLMCSQHAKWNNTLAVATNTAIAEQVGSSARQKSRLIAVKFRPGAAITGTAGDYFTLIVRKRTLATPGTQVALISFAADTATTDDVAAFGAKDLMVSTYKNASVETDFNFEAGDSVTVEVTKSTATGMTFPVSQVDFLFEPRA
jgi:hypothetical protein